jgi:predicted Zn finger-like uncharacterized protein
MLIGCPRCKASYRIDLSRIPPKGAQVRCKTCHTRFFIQDTSNTDVNRTPGNLANTDIDHPIHIKTEPSLEFPPNDTQESKSKLPIEEFVRKAIEKLRKPPNKVIGIARSGLADAFKEYYGLDPAAELARLVEEGKIVTRKEADDTLIYLPEDAPTSDILRRILDPVNTPEPKIAGPATSQEVPNEPQKGIAKKEPETEKSGGRMTLCASCGAKLAKIPGGVMRCRRCGAQVGQTVPEQKEVSHGRSEVQILLDQPPTTDSCIRILTLLGFQVQSEKPEEWTVTNSKGSKRCLSSFDDLWRYAASTARESQAAPNASRTESNWRKRLKKLAISFLMSVIIASVTKDRELSGPVFIGSYSIASIFQYLAIINHRPQYRKVFVHNVWLAAIAVFLNIPMANSEVGFLVFGVHLTNSTIPVFTIITWGYALQYAANALIGLLTVFWLTRAQQGLNHIGRQ